MSRSALPLAALLLTLGLLIFGRASDYKYSGWDDDIHIHDNPLLRIPSKQHLRTIWRHSYMGLYVPWTYTAWWNVARSLRASGRSLEGSAAAFHRLNIAVHVFNALLLFFLLRRLLYPDRDEPTADWAALAGAALFLLHPLQVEAAAWSTGFKDAWSGTWALSTLWLYIEAVRSSGRRAGVLTATATLTYILAVLAKPSALTLPLIAATLNAFVLKGGRRGHIIAGCWLVMAIPFAYFVKTLQPAASVTALSPLWQRPLVALDALAFYLFKLFVPFGLAPDHGRTPVAIFANAQVYWTWLLPVGLTAYLWRRRVAPQIWAGVLLFIIPLLPVLGLVPFTHQAISTVADRYAYLALLGPAILIAWGLGRDNKRAWQWATGVGVLLAVLCFMQIGVWKDAPALFTHTIKVNPKSTHAHNNLGHYYWLLNNDDKAAQHYRAAISADPKNGNALNNLGNLHLQRNRLKPAREFYLRALKTPNPHDHANAYNNLGVMAFRSQQYTPALALYAKAIDASPKNAKARFNAGNALLKMGQPQRALTAFRRGLALRPDSQGGRRGLSSAIGDLGFLALTKGQAKDGERLLRRSISLWPGNIKAQINLSQLFVQQKKLGAALAVLNAARRSSPKSPVLLHNIAAAHLAAGRRKLAVQMLQQIVRTFPKFAPSRRLLVSLPAQKR
jgi:tetratricopeptide (TPR) repeat protein